MTIHRKRAYIYLLMVAVIWGAAGPVIKFTLAGIDPLPFLAYRLFISACVSIFYFAIKGIKLPKPEKNLPLLIVYGLLAVTFALGLLFIGLDKSTVLDMTLIGTIGPLMVTAGGVIFFHDHITKREKLGIIVVLAGASINAFAPIFANHNNIRLAGNLFIIIFLLADSSSILFAKKMVRNKIPSITLTNFAFIVGALTVIPFTFFQAGAINVMQAIIELPLKYHLGVWYMAILSGSLAYFLFVRAQKSIEVSEAILFSYLQPVFTVPLAIFWLGERLTSTFVIGATLITTGILIAEYKQQRVKNPLFSRKSSNSLFTASLHPWTKSPRFSRSLNKKSNHKIASK